MRLSQPVTGVVLAISSLVLVACSASGDDPISRRLNYFNYISGEDIRAECGPQEDLRIRFVYNADYIEQVRTYELRARTFGKGGILKAEVYSPRLNKQIEARIPLWPWTGKEATVGLEEDAIGYLHGTLAASGFYAPPPVGTKLDSRSYYWVVTGCIQGTFVFNAWAYPSQRFKQIQFAQALEKFDHTGVPFREPKPKEAGELEAREEPARAQDSEASYMRFFVTVTDHGLVGGN